MDTETTRCTVCNSLLYDDNTAENCTGECGIEIHRPEDIYKPLDFNEEDTDDVLRELPEFEDLWDEATDELPLEEEDVQKGGS